MTQNSIFQIAACVAAISLGATGALAGAKPASPTAIVPPPPPVLPLDPSAVRLTQSQVRAAQALVSAIMANPPPSMSAPFKARTVNVLNSMLARPDLLAALGLAPSQVQALIDQVQAIPLTPG